MRVMSGLDARFLYSETRNTHMHTIKLVVVDLSARADPLPIDAIPALIESRLHRLPVFRRRVIAAPHGLGNPVMVDDPEFAIANHLHFRTLAAPGTQRELDLLVSEIAATQLPRDRPLWEMHIVTGLADGRIAFLVKLHHALADGVASVALLENAFVRDDADALTEPFAPDGLPSTRERYVAALSGAAKAASLAPRTVGRTVSGIVRARQTRQGGEVAVPGPFSGPRTPFNVALSADRTFATLSVPMSGLVSAKQAAGATLNAAYLALCGGGIRRYLQRSGDLPSSTLVASVPMATRVDQRRLARNHVDNLFLPLGTDLADPLRRITRIHQASALARSVRAAFGTELFEWRSGLIPAPAHGVIPRLWATGRLADHLRPPLNVVVSCVKGPRERLEVDGAVVTSLASSGPIIEGVGLNITGWTYGDTMFISLLGCSRSLPDPWRLAADLEDEYSAWAAADHVAERP